MQLTRVLDGSNGAVARRNKQSSGFGRCFDAVVDLRADAIILVSMLYFAWRSVDLATLLAPLTSRRSWCLLAVAGHRIVSDASAKLVADLGYACQDRRTAATSPRPTRC